MNVVYLFISCNIYAQYGTCTILCIIYCHSQLEIKSPLVLSVVGLLQIYVKKASDRRTQIPNFTMSINDHLQQQKSF